MTEEKTFRNLKQVAIYLRGKGYKISKTQIYEHGKARKIKPRDDGKFYLLDCEQYAADCLKSKDTPAQCSDATQRRRNEAEAAKLEAQARHWKKKAEILEGSYVEKGTFERALAMRAMIFKNDLSNFAYTQAPGICRLVNGNIENIPRLVEYLLEQFAIFLNHYAEDKEFIVPAPMKTGEVAECLESAEENDII